MRLTDKEEEIAMSKLHRLNIFDFLCYKEMITERTKGVKIQRYEHLKELIEAEETYRIEDLFYD